MEIDELKRAIEGILFAVGESVEVSRIAQALDVPEEEVTKAAETLSRELEEGRHGIRLLKLDTAYQMCTAKEVYGHLIQVAKQPKKQVLTDVLLETLSIIAYKQPVTKAEIEKVRGVSSVHAVNKLVDYRLVEEVGRLDAPGRPVLFGTTEEFLRSFGVSSLDDLPSLSPVQVEKFREEAENEASLEVEV